MKLHFKLTKQGVEFAIDRVKDFKNRFEAKIPVYLDRLAYEGAKAVEEAYRPHAPEQKSMPTIRIERVSDRVRAIKAEGETVAFIEFGAGDFAADIYGTGVGVSPGSWSASELGKGEYINNGYWWYNKQKFFGINPAFGFDAARSAIRRESARIAKEVFGDRH